MAPKKSENKRKSIGAVKTCGDCGTVILPTTTHIRCEQCKKSFHTACKKIDERVCRKLVRDKTPWLCEKCENDDGSDEDGMADDEDISSASTNQILAGIHKQLAKLTSKCNEITGLKKQCGDILKSQQYLSDSHDETIAQLKQCLAENRQLRSEVTALTKKCSLLSNEIDQIKSSVNVQEQAKLSSNVLIRGIHGSEDALEAVSKIANLAEMNDQLTGTVLAKRIEYQNREPVIVASFTDEKLKRQFVKQAKKNASLLKCTATLVRANPSMWTNS